MLANAPRMFLRASQVRVVATDKMTAAGRRGNGTRNGTIRTTIILTIVRRRPGPGSRRNRVDAEIYF